MANEVQVDREADGRWIAEIAEVPGVVAYGATREEAVRRVEALILRVLADRLEGGEDVGLKLMGKAVSDE